MSGVNKVILIGRLGKDPETLNPKGVQITKFSLATSETWKDQHTGERKESTEWHNIVLYRGLAEIAQKYTKKGDMVYLEGKIKTSSWDKPNGEKGYRTEIIGDVMTMLTKRTNHAEGSVQAKSGLEPAPF